MSKKQEAIENGKKELQLIIKTMNKIMSDLDSIDELEQVGALIAAKALLAFIIDKSGLDTWCVAVQLCISNPDKDIESSKNLH
jgi:hypothetical protein